jgi:hypothetical protein
MHSHMSPSHKQDNRRSKFALMPVNTHNAQIPHTHTCICTFTHVTISQTRQQTKQICTHARKHIYRTNPTYAHIYMHTCHHLTSQNTYEANLHTCIRTCTHIHRGGTCKVAPKTGIEFNDTFTVKCSDWSAEVHPFTYSFGIGAIPASETGSPDITYTTPGNTHTGSFTLPEGSYMSAARVYDAAGMWVSVSAGKFRAVPVVAGATESNMQALTACVDDIASLS